MEKIEKTIIRPGIEDGFPKDILIFGLGYTMYHLAALLVKYGIKVTVSCRSNLKHQFISTTLPKVKVIQFEDSSISPENERRLLETIKNSSAIISSIPPNLDYPDVSLYFIKKALREVLSKSLSAGFLNKKWLGYLSATSVYGNHNGRWVDEKSDCNPLSSRGKRRYRAEAEWIEFSQLHNLPCNIFRLPGIYGKNRSIIEKFQNKQYSFVDKKKHLFCRIHVIDIVRALCHSLSKPQNNKAEIYNLSDDKPASLFEIYNYAASLLDLPSPKALTVKQANLTQMQKSFYADKRKIDNKKLKQKLNFELLYPTYKEGLRAIAQQYQKP